jgi:hypothetical protein
MKVVLSYRLLSEEDHTNGHTPFRYECPTDRPKIQHPHDQTAGRSTTSTPYETIKKRAFFRTPYTTKLHNKMAIIMSHQHTRTTLRPLPDISALPYDTTCLALRLLSVLIKRPLCASNAATRSNVSSVNLSTKFVVL